MSGDSFDGTGELRKVLGLRWDTGKDEIYVDIKLKYGEKKKGAYMEENACLIEPEVNLSSRITRRVLQRVAQS